MSQSSWYAHATLGNDASDGTSWANAKLDLDGVDGAVSVLTSNDTLWTRGDFGTEDFSPANGIDNVVVIDSIFQIVNHTNMFTRTDTTILWKTEITRLNLQPNRDNYTFIGIKFDNQDNDASQIMNGASATFILCYFESATTGASVTDVSYTFSYCYFTTDNSAAFGQFVLFSGGSSVAHGHSFNHCTFYSPSTSNQTIAVSYGAAGTPVTGSWTNNIIYSAYTGSGTSQIIDYDEPDNSFVELDFNIYDINSSSYPTGIGFQWDGLATRLSFPQWKDSLQTGVKGIDPNGEDNSQFIDPVLVAGSEFGLISNGSPAVRAASDGTEIGFYQFGKPFNVRRRGIKR